MDLKVLKHFFVLVLIDVVLSANNTSQQPLSCQSWAHEPRERNPTVIPMFFKSHYYNDPAFFAVKTFHVIKGLRLSWYDAFAWCRTREMFLASPETPAERDFLKEGLIEKKLVTGKKKDDYWLSFADFSKKNTFLWMSTGRKVKYYMEGMGEPEYIAYDNKMERCGQIVTINNKTELGVYDCNCKQNFICEQAAIGVHTRSFGGPVWP